MASNPGILAPLAAEVCAPAADGAHRRHWQTEAATLASVFMVTASAVGVGQLTRSAQDHFTAPFFVMSLHLGMMAPLLLLSWAIPKKSADCDLTPCDVCVLLPLQVTSNYLYVHALALAPAGVVQVVFGTAPAVVAAVSRLLLREVLTPLCVFAVLLAVAGTITMGFGARAADHVGPVTDTGTEVFGTVLAFCAVLSAASYKVLFKKRLKSPGPQTVLRLLGYMGVVMSSVGFPIAALLAAAGVESQWWGAAAHDVDWALVIASAVLDVVYAVFVSSALALSSPVHVAVGILLSGLASMVVDALCHGAHQGVAKVCGAILIAFSFAIMTLQRHFSRAAESPALSTAS